MRNCGSCRIFLAHRVQERHLSSVFQVRLGRGVRSQQGSREQRASCWRAAQSQRLGSNTSRRPSYQSTVQQHQETRSHYTVSQKKVPTFICGKFEFLISQSNVATCLRWGEYCRMNFVANFISFAAVQNFENRLRFDKVTESLKVGTFLRHSVQHCNCILL